MEGWGSLLLVPRGRARGVGMRHKQPHIYYIEESRVLCLRNRNDATNIT